MWIFCCLFALITPLAAQISGVALEIPGIISQINSTTFAVANPAISAAAGPGVAAISGTAIVQTIGDPGLITGPVSETNTSTSGANLLPTHADSATAASNADSIASIGSQSAEVGFEPNRVQIDVDTPGRHISEGDLNSITQNNLDGASSALFLINSGFTADLGQASNRLTDIQLPGDFDGHCYGDGLYYHNTYSYYVCDHGVPYHQPCAPGTRTHPDLSLVKVRPYDHNDFCTLNMVDYGYNVPTHRENAILRVEKDFDKEIQTTISSKFQHEDDHSYYQGNLGYSGHETSNYGHISDTADVRHYVYRGEDGSMHYYHFHDNYPGFDD